MEFVEHDVLEGKKKAFCDDGKSKNLIQNHLSQF